MTGFFELMIRADKRFVYLLLRMICTYVDFRQEKVQEICMIRQSQTK